MSFPTIIRVLRAGDPKGPLTIEATADFITDDQRAEAAIIHAKEADPAWSIAYKNIYGPVGRIRTADLEALIKANTSTVPAQSPVAAQTLAIYTAGTPEEEIAVHDLPSTSVVVKQDINGADAGYLAQRLDEKTVKVFANPYSQRSTPYLIKPLLARAEAQMARKFPNALGADFGVKVKATVKRAGPSTPIDFWLDMNAAVTLIPNFLRDLRLSDAELNSMIKLAHDAGYEAGATANDDGAMVRVKNVAAVKYEFHGKENEVWIPFGDRDPDDFVRLAVLVRLLRFRDSRRNGNRSRSGYTTTTSSSSSTP